jgi:hypothetical protein
MPIVFGEMASTVGESIDAFKRYGDRVRGTYRAHYRFDPSTGNPYAPPRLERPKSLEGNPPDLIYPWEQVYLAAAACAGSDYPMIAEHLGIPLERAEVVIEGMFDPRGEFDGLSDFHAPDEARHCYRTLHVRTTLVSSAPRTDLQQLHERVVTKNMVLGALRGIPLTNELKIVPARARAEAAGGGGQ